MQALTTMKAPASGDAVFVVVKDGRAVTSATLKLSEPQMERAQDHYNYWSRRLSKMTEGRFREADRRNFFRACLVAGALDMFSTLESKNDTPLDVALQQPPMPVTEKEEAPDAPVV